MDAGEAKASIHVRLFSSPIRQRLMQSQKIKKDYLKKVRVTCLQIVYRA